LYVVMPVFALIAWWFGYQRLDIFILLIRPCEV
jgi:hypothetical protein